MCKFALQELLRKGMEALSQAEVGSALQVYFNLGELKEVRCLLCSAALAHLTGCNAWLLIHPMFAHAMPALDT